MDQLAACLASSTLFTHKHIILTVIFHVKLRWPNLVFFLPPPASKKKPPGTTEAAGRIPFALPNQQSQSTKGNRRLRRMLFVLIIITYEFTQAHKSTHIRSHIIKCCTSQAPFYMVQNSIFHKSNDLPGTTVLMHRRQISTITMAWTYFML